MIFNETTVLLNRDYCQNLRRGAERERLIQAAALRPAQAWGLSLPLLEMRRSRFNFRSALKLLLWPAKQTN